MASISDEFRECMYAYIPRISSYVSPAMDTIDISLLIFRLSLMWKEKL
jgi:hypothetical protein